jgi:YHS domain-containing protein/thiol-disulfide isomerase/thioredoxin
MKRISFGSLFYKIGILPAVLFLCFTMEIQTVAQQEIVWETNFERATTLAKSLNRPLFLHFYGDNCPPCQLMENKVFKDGQVINQMNRSFVPLKVKVAEQAQLAKKYSVQVIPTDLVLTPEGRIIHRRQGGIAVERFLEYLHFLLSNVTQDVAQQGLTQNSTPVSAPTRSVPEPTETSLISPTQFQSSPSQPSSPQTATSYQPVAGTPTNVVPVQKIEQPNIEAAHTVQPKVLEQPLRDPFTKQPVAPSLPVQANQMNHVNQTNQINQQVAAEHNPVRITENRIVQEDKSTLPKTVDAIFAPQVQAHKEPVTVPSVYPASPAGLQSNPDEIAATKTTMVEVPLGLEGYCPVLLCTEERWIPGNPAYYTMYRGHVFRFSSEEAMAEFIKTPALYAPVAMGEDIVLMVDRNKKVYGNRKFGAWFQGRVFLFSSQDSLDSFAARPEYYAEIALKYETALKGVSGRFF